MGLSGVVLRMLNACSTFGVDSDRLPSVGFLQLSGIVLRAAIPNSKLNAVCLSVDDGLVERLLIKLRSLVKFVVSIGRLGS